MLPELLRFSSANHLLKIIPEELQAHHRRKKETSLPPKPISHKHVAAVQPPKRLLAQEVNLWEGWTDSAPVKETACESDGEEMDLEGLGL